MKDKYDSLYDMKFSIDINSFEKAEVKLTNNQRKKKILWNSLSMPILIFGIILINMLLEFILNLFQLNSISYNGCSDGIGFGPDTFSDLTLLFSVFVIKPISIIILHIRIFKEIIKYEKDRKLILYNIIISPIPYLCLILLIYIHKILYL